MLIKNTELAALRFNLDLAMNAPVAYSRDQLEMAHERIERLEAGLFRALQFLHEKLGLEAPCTA